MTDAYTELVAELKRICLLGEAAGLLGWDEQVNLPPKSANRRAAQMSALSELIHRESTAPRLGDLLEALEAASTSLTPGQACVVREARRDYDRATKIPAEFVRRRSTAESEGYHAWTKARAADDFAAFAPYLEANLKLAREEAAFFGYEGAAAYDYWLDRFDPGLTGSFVEQTFAVLKRELKPIVDQILTSSVKPRTDIFRGFPVGQQEQFLRTVIGAIGFDFDRGRLDIAVHPFCAGNGGDIRMTTRYDADNPLDSLFSAIHETGHAMYEQGLPEEHIGTGLGTAVGMAVHESQSRIWENQVGRSRAFWQHWEPAYRAAFAEQLDGISSEELYLAINAVGLNPIRVDSDEVTYNLHIILRFELEQALFLNEISIPDLPTEWNRRAKEIIGLDVKTNREGVLQDVHWSGGAFGYFPSYTLGNILAAQFWFAAREALPGLDDDFACGETGRLLEWLRENIHRHGRLHSTRVLCRLVTGNDLDPAALISYLNERYLPLYADA